MFNKSTRSTQCNLKNLSLSSSTKHPRGTLQTFFLFLIRTEVPDTLSNIDVGQTKIIYRTGNGHVINYQGR